MRILITGAHGFVGANLVRWLAEALPEASIIAADVQPADAALEAFFAPVAERITTARLDVTNRAEFAWLAAWSRVTHLVHAAAVTPTAEQERADAGVVFDINLGGAANALEACLRVPSIQRAVLISSSGVYGAPGRRTTELPTRTFQHASTAALQAEDGPLQLDTMYAITKHSAELLASRYATLAAKPIVAARLTAIYGPMERPGPSRANLSHVGQLLAALHQGREVRVAGPRIARDWLHARDAAAAIRGLLQAPLRHAVYNVGSGTTTSFSALVAAFQAHGLRARWVAETGAASIAAHPHQARAPLDCSRLWADTGARPAIPLAQGIAALVAAEDV